MYRVIKKVTKRNEIFFVQRRYGIFWLYLFSIFGWFLFSSFLVGIVSIFVYLFLNSIFGIVLFICNIIYLILIIVNFISELIIFKEFDYLSQAKDYINSKILEKKFKSNKVIIYLNEKDERADKLRKLKMKRFLFFFKIKQ